MGLLQQDAPRPGVATDDNPMINTGGRRDRRRCRGSSDPPG
jgi:hypothetical protein